MRLVVELSCMMNSFFNEHNMGKFNLESHLLSQVKSLFVKQETKPVFWTTFEHSVRVREGSKHIHLPG